MHDRDYTLQCVRLEWKRRHYRDSLRCILWTIQEWVWHCTHNNKGA